MTPLYVPAAHPGSEIDDLVALLSQTVSDYSEYPDKGRQVREPSEAERELLDDSRGTLIEGIIEESEDESLMDRYMGGEEIDFSLLVDDLETAVARASFFPVIPVCAQSGLGLEELLEIITQAFPPPSEHTFPDVFTTIGKPVDSLSCDPSGPLLAEVVKSTSDPYVGRISLVRVFSGTVRPDATVHVSGHFSEFYGGERGHEDHDEDERIGALSSPLGKTQRLTGSAIAGDICAIAKLSRAETGDTLSDKENPLVMEPWSMPEPLLPIALIAHAKADEDKLGQALQRLAAEDPTVRIEHHPETLQLVLWCMGEAHADVLLDRLRNRHGVQVDQVDVRVPLRETLAGKGSGKGRHVKQSGGHGQYAVCDIDGGAAAGRQWIRVRRQSRRGLRSAPVHPQRRERRAGTAREGAARRVSGRRRAGHAARRQGAQRRLERHGLPDRRPARPARGSDSGRRSAARADRRGRRADRRRLRRRRHGRLVGATRPRARHRAGGARTHPGQGRDAAARTRQVRDRSAVAEPWHRHVLAPVRAVRPDAATRCGEGRS